MSSPSRSLVLFVFAASSCALVPGGGGVELAGELCTVRADDLATAQQVHEIVAALDGPIRAMLDAEGAPAPRILVEDGRGPGHQLGALTTSGIEVYELGAADGGRRVLAHEMVHWYAHHGPGYWKRLPHAVEEGLALLSEHWVTGAHRVVVTALRQRFDPRAFTVSFAECDGMDPRARTRIHMTGRWVVAVLGIEQLRELAERAAREGEATVPREWIEAWLPPPSEQVSIDSPLPEFRSELHTDVVVGLLPDR